MLTVNHRLPSNQLTTPLPSSDVKASQTGEGEVRRRSAWREFCSSTAIHGLRYLAQRDLNKFEK